MADSVASPDPAPDPGPGHAPDPGPGHAPDAGLVVGPAAARPDIAAVVLAAGAGERLRPLTRLRPKALCPVGNVPLVDLALDRVRAAVPSGAIAVNVHHGRAQLEAHLADHRDVHVSIEQAQALGTAGALGYLRPWLAGRAALVVNADAWCDPDLATFVAGWDGERVRILVRGHEPFGPTSGIVASLLPWSEVARLQPEPSGLYELSWRPQAAAGAIETVPYDGPFVDCGTPAHYLAANLQAIARQRGESEGSVIADGATIVPGAQVSSSAVGAGARVAGQVRSSVVWPGAEVAPAEILDHAIRTGPDLTVLVR